MSAATAESRRMVRVYWREVRRGAGLTVDCIALTLPVGRVDLAAFAVLVYARGLLYFGVLLAIAAMVEALAAMDRAWHGLSKKGESPCRSTPSTTAGS